MYVNETIIHVNLHKTAGMPHLHAYCHSVYRSVVVRLDQSKFHPNGFILHWPMFQTFYFQKANGPNLTSHVKAANDAWICPITGDTTFCSGWHQTVALII